MPIKCRLCDKPATQLFHCDEHYCCAGCGTSEHLCTYTEAVLCSPCHDKRVEKRIAEFTGDTDHTNEVTCPHCGHECIDSWDMSEGEHECGDCGREFTMERDVSVSYSTTKRHNAQGNRRAAFGASVLTDGLDGNGTGRHE
jgi:hypothetical protein